MNILLRGGGFGNKGDEAMMLTVQRELSQRYPTVNLLWRGSPHQAERAQACGLVTSAASGGSVGRALRLARKCITDTYVRRAVYRDLISAEAIGEIRNIDGVVDFSGFNYSDQWGFTYAKPGLAFAEYCTARGKPFICLPQAWGPFQRPDIAAAVRRLCKCSAVVYARDKVSLAHLRGILGSDGDTIRIAPDVAFLFHGDSAQVGRAYLRSLGIEIERSPVVGIAPNMRIYERCRGEGMSNEYVQLMIKIANNCIRSWGASVLLVSHGFSVRRPGIKDDRFLCGLIDMGVREANRCFVIREYVSAKLTKSIESQLDFLISSRFHGCVFALSTGVPSVALGWTHKYRELMATLGLEDNAVLHTEFDEKRTLELIDKAWESRKTAKAVITEYLPDVMRNAAHVFDDVVEILTSRQTRS